MKLQQVSDNCFAVLNEKKLVCNAKSGLINLGGGVDTQSDLPHGRRMIGLFGKVWKATPRRVINTHEDGDPVWGNQLFEGAMEIKVDLEPGTVVGMGTIADRTGLDHDDFIDPGSEIEMSFEQLGTLRCRFAETARRLLPSPWPLRLAQQSCHGL